jgi:hypothetical protein
MAGGLFVPLDVDYYTDDKILSVSPLAELLYVRSLAFAKRARMDGLLATRQLPVFGQRLDHRKRMVDQLVDSGLWTRNGDGWYISAWLKRNSPTGDLSENRADAGAMGAHIRWHVNTGRPNPTCQWCQTDGLPG